jgi:hypothetical protein
MLSYSFSLKTLFASTSLVTMIFSHPVLAQVISNISVDPYNDSNFESIPINVNAPQVNNSKVEDKITIPSNNTIYINGSPTPTPPSQLTGNLTSSNKPLPPIPNLSEPYSKQQEPNNLNNSNQPEQDETNLSSENSGSITISVSSVDMTPSNNNLGKTSQSISSNNSVQKVNENQNLEINVNQPTTTRRTLRDILVQSNSNSQSSDFVSHNAIVTNQTQTIYKVLVKVNSLEQENKVKSLYPEAFTKKIKNDSFLQIGIFSNKESVEQISQAIANIGLKAIIQ